MDLGLKNRVVIVTGAASGIGKAIAIAYAKEGDFLVFMPQDAHMPCIAIDDKPSYVKKAVVKIKI